MKINIIDGKSADGVVEEGKFKRRPTRSISKSFQTEQPQTMLSKVDSKKRLGSQCTFFSFNIIHFSVSEIIFSSLAEKKEAEPVSFLAATREKASDKQKLSLSTLAIENSTQSNQNTPPRKQMFSLSTLSDGKTSAATASLIDFLDEFKENDQKEKQQQQQRKFTSFFPTRAIQYNFFVLNSLGVNRTNSTAGEPMVQPKSKEIDFSVKDSDDNIIFMDGSNELIKAATFSKLIERLTCATGYLGTQYIFSLFFFIIFSFVIHYVRFEIKNENLLFFSPLSRYYYYDHVNIN